MIGRQEATESGARYRRLVAEPWDDRLAGVLRLPSGRRVRGRSLKGTQPEPLPDFSIWLLGHRPPGVEWESRWVRWPDFWIPTDRHLARAAFQEGLDRAEYERVEVACSGGLGRTGTALACLAVLDGVAGTDAVAYVREHYSRHAVETPWQRRYVRNFA